MSPSCPAFSHAQHASSPTADARSARGISRANRGSEALARSLRNSSSSSSSRKLLYNRRTDITIAKLCRCSTHLSAATVVWGRELAHIDAIAHNQCGFVTRIVLTAEDCCCGTECELHRHCWPRQPPDLCILCLYPDLCAPRACSHCCITKAATPWAIAPNTHTFLMAV
jgi:hypothetical protein